MFKKVTVKKRFENFKKDKTNKGRTIVRRVRTVSSLVDELYK